MNILFYFFLPATILLLAYTWLYFTLGRAMALAEAAWTDLNDLIVKRNTIVLGLIRLLEDRVSEVKEVADNVRKYGKLSAIAITSEEKALNAELFRKNLAETMEIAKASPEVTIDPDFIKACRELRDIEYKVDTVSLRYNNLVFRHNSIISGSITGIPAALLRVAKRPYFAAGHNGMTEKPVGKINSKVRDLADTFILAIDKDTIINCSCGLDIRIPSDFRSERVVCQLCKTSHEVPSQHLRAAAALLGQDVPMEFVPKALGTDNKDTKHARGWGLLSCTCGNVAQLSPDFSAPYVRCSSCGNKIKPKSREDQNVSAVTNGGGR